MSDLPNLPEQEPTEPQDPPPPEESTAHEPLQLVTAPPPGAFQPSPDILQSEAFHDLRIDEIPPLFNDVLRPQVRPQERIPNFGHVGILILLMLCGLFGAGLIVRLAVHYHLFGVLTFGQAATEIHYTLGSEGIFYILTFAGCLLVFPLLWQKGFFDGLQWRGAVALRVRGRLIGAAFVCFIIAFINGLFMPGPSDAPIDKIFRMPGAAWLLFIFGVTLAPFFEEIAFRGFLLPAFCTAWDWAIEKGTGRTALPLDADGHPQWSTFAMIVSSIITSILFSLMHGDQTGWSLGPFLLLICVSLVLCWARLSTRSLAASVLLHACYNFLLFSLVFYGTGGFKHLENM